MFELGCPIFQSLSQICTSHSKHSIQSLVDFLTSSNVILNSIFFYIVTGQTLSCIYTRKHTDATEEKFNHTYLIQNVASWSHASYLIDPLQESIQIESCSSALVYQTLVAKLLFLHCTPGLLRHSFDLQYCLLLTSP